MNEQIASDKEIDQRFVHKISAFSTHFTVAKAQGMKVE